MAARKKTTTQKADTEQTGDEGQAADTGPGDIAVGEEFGEQGPATPTDTIRVRGADDEERPRYAGHVLTEKGWRLQ